MLLLLFFLLPCYWDETGHLSLCCTADVVISFHLSLLVFSVHSSISFLFLPYSSLLLLSWGLHLFLQPPCFFLSYAHLCSPLLTFAHLCRSYPCPGSIVITAFLHCFSVLCENWIELVLSHIAPHSVYPPQSGPSSRSLPSHLHRCYLLCNVRVFSSHHMAIPRKAFLGDICSDRLDHCVVPELFISEFVFPCSALSHIFSIISHLSF